MTPLAECSRHDKLRAMAFVPALPEMIAARAEEIDSDAAKTAKGVQTVLASLSPSFLPCAVPCRVLRGIPSGDAPLVGPQEVASLMTLASKTPK